MEQEKRLSFKLKVPEGATGTVVDFLAKESGLSKARIKDAMNKGAVWVRTPGGGRERFRRATRDVRPGMAFEIHYDERLLASKAPAGTLLKDCTHYTVWLKPAGLMAQGTEFGDHASLLRQVELFFAPKRRVFLVHRLDREVEGLMLIAHTREAAAKLSELFRSGQIEKRYRAEVKGDITDKGKEGTIDTPLDDRAAITKFEVVSVEEEGRFSVVHAVIETGRYHQIRRHMEAIGHPVIGDPRYGTGNKNSSGMRLWAISLRFMCPFEKKEVEFHVPGAVPKEAAPASGNG